jgi:hypothetical protein
MELVIKQFQTNTENLFIETNHPDYKWIKNHYNDPSVSDSEREFADFDDSFIDVKVGKHKLKYIAPNVFPKHATETIAVVGKAKGKDFIVDKLVLCRFMYDGPNSYEIIGVAYKDRAEFNKEGTLVLKKKKI